MNEWKKDGRSDVVMVDIEGLVPENHLLRKVERVMDYEWLYERLAPYYCHDNGRKGTDPVVLIKMVLIQHMFGIPSLRQTHQRISDTLSYRWFLGYNLVEKIPHFATVSYAFCNRFPQELAEEIFEHVLNKAINNRMVDPSVIFIDGTHIKASANKNKHKKEMVTKAAKEYSDRLFAEVNEDRVKLGKAPFEAEKYDDNNNNNVTLQEDNDDNGSSNENNCNGDDNKNCNNEKQCQTKSSNKSQQVEKTVSTTDPDCGMFMKGEHERQFAYEAHTVCERHGFILDVEVTAGNVNDSVAWDIVYDRVIEKFSVDCATMDAGYKTFWIAKKMIEGGKIPLLPYTRSTRNKEEYRPDEYSYDEATDTYTCPMGGVLRHTTTSRDGNRTYRTTPSKCVHCPNKEKCGANEKGQKVLTRHIWQKYIDFAEMARKSERGKELYPKRKETIERVFADAKEKHSMRYTQHRGLPKVTQWVRLKFAAMNLKKLATWSENKLNFLLVFHPFMSFSHINHPRACS